MRTHDAKPASAGTSHPAHRIGRRGIAGAVLVSLTAGCLTATALPAAAVEQPRPAGAAASATALAAPVRVQAEDYSADNGNGLKKEGAAPGGNVGGTWNGGELTFQNVAFGDAALDTVTVRSSTRDERVGANPRLEFYLDSKSDANRIGTVALPKTGGWGNYVNTTVDLDRAVSGGHALVVVMRVDPIAGQEFNYVSNFDWFEFGQAAVELPDTYLDATSVWNYSENGVDPSGDGTLAWTASAFDDSAWKSATGAFGAKSNSPTPNLGAAFPVKTVLKHYLNGTSAPAVPTYHFRTDVDVTAGELAEIDSLQGSITYDDAVRIYVNGTKVAGFEDARVDTAANQNLTYAGNSNGDPRTSTFSVPGELLHAGENTVSVALYQDRETSSDIYLDVTSLSPVEKDAPAEISDIVLGVGATEAERNLAWYTNVDVLQTVQLAKATEVTGDAFPLVAEFATSKSGATTSGEFFRDATLTGLEENTEYAYRVGSEANGWSSVATFRTQDFSGDFSFLFFGDPQVGASGSLSRDEAGWVDTVKVASESYPDAELLFSAGDQVESASNEDQYKSFLAPEQVRSIPVVPTNGNHDVGSKAYEQHFNVPNEDLTAGAGSGSASGGDYWFIYKDVLFVNINSNSRDYASHNAFLEKVVAEQGDKATWKVLAFHHSIYSVASHYDDSDIIERRGTMPTTISSLGFDAVLMGHDHNYTRSYLVKNGELADKKELAGQARVEAKDGEVLYLTANSSSGSKYYDTKAPDAWFASVINQEKVRNYSVVEVTGDTLTFRTMRSQVNGADKPVNSVVDEVELTRDAAPELSVPADGTVAFGSAFDPLAGVSAADNVDGDLTSAITVEGAVDTSKLGAATLTYTVTDARGNVTTRERTVTVVEGQLTAAVPSVSGTAKVGATLTAKPGTWTTGAALSYQWLRNGAAIKGATASTYKVAGTDAGTRLSVKVTGTLAGYASASKTSAQTAAIAKGSLTAGVPKVSGTVKVGKKLSVSAGSWTKGVKLSYQWLRNGKAISKATKSTYSLVGADAGTRVSVKVTGSLAGYSTVSKTSAATKAVAKGSLKAGSVKITGSAKVGKKLSVSAGSWTKGVKLSYQWLRNGKPISKATKSTYTVVSGDRGDRISVKVTGTLAGYTTVTKTAPSKVIAKK